MRGILVAGDFSLPTLFEKEGKRILYKLCTSFRIEHLLSTGQEM